MLARGSGPWIAAPLAGSIAFAAAGAVFSHIAIHVALALSVLLLGGFLVFFRDPERVPGAGVVSPADGRVQRVAAGMAAPDGVRAEGTERTDTGNDVTGAQRYLKLEIFMNVHNVHVNRMPVTGVIQDLQRRSGGFRPAFDKDADSNERVVYTVRPEGREGTLNNDNPTVDLNDPGTIYMVQIAGAVARRIVPYVAPPARLARGDRFGLIRLGSRVDLYLPEGRYEATVREGEKVRAGETTVAREREEERKDRSNDRDTARRGVSDDR